MNPAKVYVETTVRFDCEGHPIPLDILWEDGRRFCVDKITDVRRAASLKAGGIGTRFTVRICGRETFLFWDGVRWFVERRIN